MSCRLCLYNFTLIVVLLNMLITLMGEVYKKVRRGSSAEQQGPD
jgi:hypothetical protein